MKLESEKIIQMCNNFDKKVHDLGLQNEQWFLDWQDSLNEISVRQ